MALWRGGLGFFLRLAAGLVNSTLYNCTLNGNSASGAAAGLQSTLYNCTVHG